MFRINFLKQENQNQQLTIRRYRQLLSEQIKDGDGKTLPRDVSKESLHTMDYSSNQGTSKDARKQDKMKNIDNRRLTLTSFLYEEPQNIFNKKTKKVDLVPRFDF